MANKRTPCPACNEEMPLVWAEVYWCHRCETRWFLETLVARGDHPFESRNAQREYGLDTDAV